MCVRERNTIKESKRQSQVGGLKPLAHSLKIDFGTPTLASDLSCSVLRNLSSVAQQYAETLKFD